MKTLCTLALSLLLTAGLAAAQTTVVYDVPAGDTCNNTFSGCTLHNLTPEPNQILPYWGTPFAYLVYGHLVAFQLFQGQNAAAGASYCDPASVVQSTATITDGPYAGDTMFMFTCNINQGTNGTGSGEIVAPSSGTISASIAAHSKVVISPCGRWLCRATVWTVDEGTVTVTGTTP